MDEQVCSKCKKQKSLNEFGKGNKKNGKSSHCKNCTAIRNKKWYSDPVVKVKTNARERERRRSDPQRYLWTHVRDRSKRNGIPFNLTIDDCKIPSICPVLGIPIVTGKVRAKGCMVDDNVPSVDRIDPTKGYIKGNVEVISWRANHLKNNATVEELEAIVNYMKLHGGCNGEPS